MFAFENHDNPEVVVITFTGSHRFGIYNDCRASYLRLAKSLEQYDVRLINYTMCDLLRILRPIDSSLFYFFTRYGAGAWFWKPIIIQDALKRIKPANLIYVDSDCVFLRDPNEIISASLFDKDMAFFSQKNKLGEWISNRASKLLELSDDILESSSLVTAGIVILKNSESSIASLRTWETCSNPSFPGESEMKAPN